MGRIAPKSHTLVMLADPMISVRRFFERPDLEKQFLYRFYVFRDSIDTAKNGKENYHESGSQRSIS